MTFRRRPGGGVNLYSRRRRRRRGELRIELKNGSAATAKDSTRRRRVGETDERARNRWKSNDTNGKPYRDTVSFLTRRRTCRPPFDFRIYSFGSGKRKFSENLSGVGGV